MSAPAAATVTVRSFYFLSINSSDVYVDVSMIKCADGRNVDAAVAKPSRQHVPAVINLYPTVRSGLIAMTHRRTRCTATWKFYRPNSLRSPSLAKNAWSMAIRLSLATNEYAPPNISCQVLSDYRSKWPGLMRQKLVLFSYDCYLSVTSFSL